MLTKHNNKRDNYTHPNHMQDVREGVSEPMDLD